MSLFGHASIKMFPPLNQYLKRPLLNPVRYFTNLVLCVGKRCPTQAALNLSLK